MSPEQIRNQKVDHRSDIWSFGVILYEMITGRYPFKGEHDASLFYSIINQNPEPLARYKSNISDDFQRIIDKALNKEPETRYQHIDEILSDLKRIGGESSKNKIKSKKRHYYIVAALIIAAMIFLSTNYFLNNNSKIIKPPKHTQLTFDGNVDLFRSGGPLYDLAMISPAGQFIAYVIDKGEEKSIYVKEISSDKAIEVFKGLNLVTNLRWSPSGKKLLFNGLQSNNIWSGFITNKFGGNIRQILYHFTICWSPDETMLAYIKGGDYNEIEIINRETGEITRTITLQGIFNSISNIDWSYKEDKITFLTFDIKTKKNIIWTVKTDGSQQQKIWEKTKNNI